MRLARLGTGSLGIALALAAPAWADLGRAVEALDGAAQGTAFGLEAARYYLREAVGLPVVRRLSAAGAAGGDGPSRYPRLAAGGGVAVFASDATNLVPGDANGVEDTFVVDRATPTIERASVGTAASGGGDRAVVSAGGRFVAFTSPFGLDPSDTNDANDVYVYDRTAGTLARASVATDGSEGARFENSEFPDLSADGRFVAFTTIAALAPDDTNDAIDVYVRDRDTDADGVFDEPGAVSTERASVRTGGAEGGAASGFPALSADGALVAFESAFPYVAEDANGLSDVYVRDRAAGTTVRVSVDAAGAEGAGFSANAALSATGRFVAFVSSSAFVAADTNGTVDIYVVDRDTDTNGVFDEPGAIGIERASVRTGGGEVAASALTPRISADGRFVVFDSFGAFVPEDTNGARDVFVRDRATGATARASEGYVGEAGGSSAFAAISADGRSIAFESDAADLVPDDGNGVKDVFVVGNPLTE